VGRLPSGPIGMMPLRSSGGSPDFAQILQS
jgi:hypothetical protein